MRRQDREESGPTVTHIEQVVECNMLKGKGDMHAVRVGLSEEGVLAYIESDCPMAGPEYEAIRRLGGTTCANTALSFIETLGGATSAREAQLPSFLRQAAVLCENRVRDVGRSRYDSQPFDEEIKSIVERTERTLNAKVQKVTGIPSIRMDLIVHDDGERTWMLSLDYQTLARRAWGTRGWRFDEVNISKQLSGKPDAFFIDPKLGRRGYIKTTDDFCVVCRKSYRNRRGHSLTVGHADKVIARLRKAMRAFPGPKAIKRSE